MKLPLISRNYKFLVTIGIALLGLIITYMLKTHIDIPYSNAHFLGIHTLIELITVFLSFTVVAIVWFLRDGLDDYQGKFILMLGMNFLAVGVLDLFHTLSYEGMPELMTPSSGQKATIFWLFARFWGAAAFLLVFFLNKRLAKTDTREIASLFLGINLAVSIILCVVATTRPESIPPLLEKGAGLTILKIGLELLLVVLYAITLLRVWTLKKNGISENVLANLGYFLIFTVFSELTFMTYSTIYDAYNLTGHIYKLFAYYFLFQAVYCSGVINNLYTLGEMAKMSAELLKQDISLEPIISVQMNKLRKILPQIERIAVYICDGNAGYYRANYVWGRFREQLPAGQRFRLKIITEKFGHKSVILNDPMDLLLIFKVDGLSADIPIEIPLMLKEAKQLMYIPLTSGSQHFGVIVIYTFSAVNHFGADDLEKAQVFQQFSTLAIAQAKNQEIISKLSYEDSLTGLPNRRGFFNELQDIKAAAKRTSEPYTVIFADMNGLKFVNDTLGHAAGDQALKLIGKLLKQECGKLGLAARLGGDEFAIAYQNMGLETANIAIEQLRKRLSSIKLPEYDVMFSLAIGGATFPDEACDEETLVKLADDRMYAHKREVKQSGTGVTMITKTE